MGDLSSCVGKQDDSNRKFENIEEKLEKQWLEQVLKCLFFKWLDQTSTWHGRSNTMST